MALTIQQTSQKKTPSFQICKRIDSQCRKAVLTFNMITPTTKHIAIALSGGKDSIAALIHLNHLRGHGFHNFDLTAIHVNG